MQARPSGSFHLLGLLMLSGPAFAADVFVSTYGATPGDGIDDTTQIQNAIDACAPGDRLVFAPGQFDLFKSVAANQGLKLENKQNLEVDGQGALLMLNRFSVNNPALYGFNGVFTITGGSDVAETTTGTAISTAKGLIRPPVM